MLFLWCKSLEGFEIWNKITLEKLFEFLIFFQIFNAKIKFQIRIGFEFLMCAKNYLDAVVQTLRVWFSVC